MATISDDTEPLVEDAGGVISSSDAESADKPARPSAASSLPPLRTYRRRWYILALYSLLCAFQGTVWITFGPITAAALVAFPGWTNTTISMLSNMGPITFVLFAAPYSWVLNRYGVRPGILVMSGCMAAGAALRCASSDPDVFTYLAFAGAALNGVAGVMAMSAPPLISELWFPPEERTTATGIVLMMGCVLGYVIGPLLVRDPRDGHADAASVRRDVMNVMYVEAGVTALLFVLVLVYFPSKPPQPPSVSAAQESGSVLDNLRQAARAPDLAWVVLAYVLSMGALSAYTSVLDISVSQIGVSQDQAGWLGFWSGIAASAASLLVTRLTDIFRGYMKITLIGLLLAGTVSCAWLLALIAQWIPYSLPMLYASILLAVSFVSSTVPLLLEYAVELSHPVSADIIGVIMAVSLNALQLVTLLMFLVKSLSENTLWFNYMLVVCCLLPALMILKTREVYRRTNTDLADAAEGAADTSARTITT